MASLDCLSIFEAGSFGSDSGDVEVLIFGVPFPITLTGRGIGRGASYGYAVKAGDVPQRVARGHGASYGFATKAGGGAQRVARGYGASWGYAVSAPAALLTYQTAAQDGTNLTAYTFSAQAIGTAAADRVVFAGAISQGTVTGVSVTIGGITATRRGFKHLNASSLEFWAADVPTGTTADVVVTWSGPATRCGIAVWSAVGLGSDVPVAFNGINMSTAPGASDLTIDSLAGGFVLAIGINDGISGGNTIAVNNLTERNESDLEGTGVRVQAADAATPGTSITVGMDCPVGSAQSPYLVASFGRASDPAACILDGTSPKGAFSISRALLTSYQGGPRYDLSGSDITGIRDQSGIGDVTDGATSTRRPALSTAGPNSVACADFDGSSDYLTGLAMSSYLSVSSKWIVVSGIFDSITEALTASFATVGHAIIADSGGQIGLFGCVDSVDKVFAANYPGGATDNHVGIAVTEGTAYVITLRHVSNVLYVSVNGGAESSIASNSTSSLAGTLRFGYRGNAFFNGKLFEAALWTTIPDLTTRDTIIADFKSHIGA